MVTLLCFLSSEIQFECTINAFLFSNLILQFAIYIFSSIPEKNDQASMLKKYDASMIFFPSLLTDVLIDQRIL